MTFSLPLFIARRMRHGTQEGKKVSRPAVRIAVWGIGIGVFIMLLSVSIALGFKREVGQKIAGFGQDVCITGLETLIHREPQALCVPHDWQRQLAQQPGVKHVQRYSLRPGVAKTADSFTGVVLKGVGQEFDSHFLQQHLVAGKVPPYADTAALRHVMLSEAVCHKMNYTLGQPVDLYFIDTHGVRLRRPVLAGIYRTGITQFDETYAFSDLGPINQLNGWNSQQCSGLEIKLADFSRLDEQTYSLYDFAQKHPLADTDEYVVQNVKQLNSQIFGWLDLLDVNVWVILALIAAVSGFTMVSGILIIIIERTGMIGVLKALGCPDNKLRHSFLWLACFMVGKGLLYGNLAALLCCLVQQYAGWLKLDPSVYYVETVPVLIHPGAWLAVNFFALLSALLMTVAPSYLIGRIHPAATIRYE